jgi:PhnB protein
MSKQVKAVPEGLRTVTPHLMLQDVAQAMEFYKRAFGAKEIVRMSGPQGKVTHGQIQIGDSNVFLGPAPSAGQLGSPESLGRTTVSIFLYLENVDPIFNQAVSAGAKVAQPLADMFWGDRYGVLIDPFGHSWSMATHIEDVAPEELGKRAQEAMAKAQRAQTAG